MNSYIMFAALSFQYDLSKKFYSGIKHAIHQTNCSGNRMSAHVKGEQLLQSGKAGNLLKVSIIFWYKAQNSFAARIEL